MDRLIIDASVVVASLLPDEPYRDAALRVLASSFSNSLRLLTIPLLKYEVINSVNVALKAKRIEQQDAVEILTRFDHFRIAEGDVASAAILKLAQQHSRSAYDAAYLALAEAERTPLVTADKRLYRALKDRFPWLLWIEDFE